MRSMRRGMAERAGAVKALFQRGKVAARRVAPCSNKINLLRCPTKRFRPIDFIREKTVLSNCRDAV